MPKKALKEYENGYGEIFNCIAQYVDFLHQAAVKISAEVQKHNRRFQKILRNNDSSEKFQSILDESLASVPEISLHFIKRTRSKIFLQSFLSTALPVQDCSQKSGESVVDFLNSVVPNQCVKITSKTNGNEYVARGCIPYSGGVCSAVVKILGFFSGLSGGASDVNCYTCDSDKCDSSFSIRPSLAAYS
ncbi:hypothetical protein WA026_014081 [Henosepilachna vigintioctopunctata]|uniref:Uncharacterized protein n=1 Tax=Henosepilachna vigintioctopunctata TaxID=420089 RepID=A0AAW1TYP5_9CUCU